MNDIIITANDMDLVHQKLTHPKILKGAQTGLFSLLIDQDGCVLSVPNQHVDVYVSRLRQGLEGTPGLQIVKA